MGGQQRASSGPGCCLAWPAMLRCLVALRPAPTSPRLLLAQPQLSRRQARESLDRSVCWPSSWVAREVPDARLLSLEYAAPATGWEVSTESPAAAAPRSV